MDNKIYATPIKSIRRKCLDCVGGSAKEVKLCPCDGERSTLCDLFPYRFGKRPAESKKRNLTNEQKQKIVEIFKKAKEAKRAAVEHL